MLPTMKGILKKLSNKGSKRLNTLTKVDWWVEQLIQKANVKFRSTMCLIDAYTHTHTHTDMCIENNLL